MSFSPCPKRKFISACVVLLLALATSGYADFAGIFPHGRLLNETDVKPDNTFPLSPAHLPSREKGNSLASDWWRDFGDSQLNRLVEFALAGNPGMELARARLDAARATSETAGAVLRPQFDFSGDTRRELLFAKR